LPVKVANNLDDSVKVVVNDAGKAITRYEYKPYGESWFTEGDEEFAPKYNSQELDKETNFYFYNARYYDPEICRFVTADNIVPYENDTQSWNRLSYVRNNPINYSDPTGHYDFGGLDTKQNSVGDQLLNSLSTPGKNDSYNSKVGGDVESKLQKAKGKENAISPSKPLQQYDKTLNPGNDTNMKNTGCFFMVVKNQAEREAKKNMTADEINATRETTQEGKNPAVQKNMYVKRANDVGDEALKQLGITDKVMVVGGQPQKGEKPSGTIIGGKAYDSKGNPYLDKKGNPIIHYKSGDANGNEVYNPADNIITREDKVINNVYIRQKPKEK